MAKCDTAGADSRQHDGAIVLRDDQIQTNPFWRDSFRQRRRLVPAGAFCEPNGDVKPATWHWFAIRGDGERPLFAFPGIWRQYKGPVKKDGPNVDIETYAFLMTTPNKLVGTINQERMPVSLTREEEFETWLRGSSDEAFALAREYPAESQRAHAHHQARNARSAQPLSIRAAWRLAHLERAAPLGQKSSVESLTPPMARPSWSTLRIELWSNVLAALETALQARTQ